METSGSFELPMQVFPAYPALHVHMHPSGSEELRRQEPNWPQGWNMSHHDTHPSQDELAINPSSHVRPDTVQDAKVKSAMPK